MVRFNPNLLIAEVTMKSFEGKEYKHCQIVSWWCAKTSITEKSDFLLRNSIRNFFLQTINTVTCFICIMENLQKEFSTEPGPIQQCLGPTQIASIQDNDVQNPQMAPIYLSSERLQKWQIYIHSLYILLIVFLWYTRYCFDLIQTVTLIQLHGKNEKKDTTKTHEIDRWNSSVQPYHNTLTLYS